MITNVWFNFISLLKEVIIDASKHYIFILLSYKFH